MHNIWLIYRFIVDWLTDWLIYLFTIHYCWTPSEQYLNYIHDADKFENNK
jgi:hypothetical protein